MILYSLKCGDAICFPWLLDIQTLCFGNLEEALESFACVYACRRSAQSYGGSSVRFQSEVWLGEHACLAIIK